MQILSPSNGLRLTIVGTCVFDVNGADSINRLCFLSLPLSFLDAGCDIAMGDSAEEADGIEDIVCW